MDARFKLLSDISDHIEKVGEPHRDNDGGEWEINSFYLDVQTEKYTIKTNSGEALTLNKLQGGEGDIYGYTQTKQRYVMLDDKLLFHTISVFTLRHKVTLDAETECQVQEKAFDATVNAVVEDEIDDALLVELKMML